MSCPVSSNWTTPQWPTASVRSGPTLGPQRSTAARARSARHRSLPAAQTAQCALMDADERKLLDDTLLGLAEDPQHDDLTAALDEFGWRDVLAAEPHAAIASLFGAQGRTGRWSSALQDVVAVGIEQIGGTGPTDVLLPRPNYSVTATELGGGGITVHGVLLAPRHAATLLVLVESSGAGRRVVVLDPDDLVVTPRIGLDPGLAVREVTGHAREIAVLAQAEAADLWWDHTQALSRLAICHHIVGSLFVMIEQARSHVSQREQFGRLVGTFQAVRHKLVEAHVATTAAESCTATAWESTRLASGRSHGQSRDRQSRRGGVRAHSTASCRSGIHCGPSVPSLHEAGPRARANVRELHGAGIRTRVSAARGWRSTSAGGAVSEPGGDALPSLTALPSGC